MSDTPWISHESLRREKATEKTDGDYGCTPRGAAASCAPRDCLPARARLRLRPPTSWLAVPARTRLWLRPAPPPPLGSASDGAVDRAWTHSATAGNGRGLEQPCAIDVVAPHLPATSLPSSRRDLVSGRSRPLHRCAARSSPPSPVKPLPGVTVDGNPFRAMHRP
ncbi:hypothetical protein D1007_48466 [Hordeum vulgare]|nr:hypothetical protein D1007_48466 [Hordeum vulgare]